MSSSTQVCACADAPPSRAPVHLPSSSDPRTSISEDGRFASQLSGHVGNVSDGKHESTDRASIRIAVYYRYDISNRARHGSPLTEFFGGELNLRLLEAKGDLVTSSIGDVPPQCSSTASSVLTSRDLTCLPASTGLLKCRPLSS